MQMKKTFELNGYNVKVLCQKKDGIGYSYRAITVGNKKLTFGEMINLYSKYVKTNKMSEDKHDSIIDILSGIVDYIYYVRRREEKDLEWTSEDDDKYLDFCFSKVLDIVLKYGKLVK